MLTDHLQRVLDSIPADGDWHAVRSLPWTSNDYQKLRYLDGCDMQTKVIRPGCVGVYVKRKD